MEINTIRDKSNFCLDKSKNYIKYVDDDNNPKILSINNFQQLRFFKFHAFILAELKYTVQLKYSIHLIQAIIIEQEIYIAIQLYTHLQNFYLFKDVTFFSLFFFFTLIRRDKRGGLTRGNFVAKPAESGNEKGNSTDTLRG